MLAMLSLPCAASGLCLRTGPPSRPAHSAAYGCLHLPARRREVEDGVGDEFRMPKQRRRATFAQDQDAVAEREQFRHLRAGDQDGDPLRRQLADEAIDLRLGAHVDAAGRLVEQQHARRRRQPLADHNLLLVAAGQSPGGLLRTRGADRQRLDGTQRQSGGLAALDQTEARQGRHHRQREIALDRRCPAPARRACGPRSPEPARRAWPRAAS